MFSHNVVMIPKQHNLAAFLDAAGQVFVCVCLCVSTCERETAAFKVFLSVDDKQAINNRVNKYVRACVCFCVWDVDKLSGVD